MEFIIDLKKKIENYKINKKRSNFVKGKKCVFYNKEIVNNKRNTSKKNSTIKN